MLTLLLHSSSIIAGKNQKLSSLTGLVQKGTRPEKEDANLPQAPLMHSRIIPMAWQGVPVMAGRGWVYGSVEIRSL
jgi:hypothetical protein